MQAVSTMKQPQNQTAYENAGPEVAEPDTSYTDIEIESDEDSEEGQREEEHQNMPPPAAEDRTEAIARTVFRHSDHRGATPRPSGISSNGGEGKRLPAPRL